MDVCTALVAGIDQLTNKILPTRAEALLAWSVRSVNDRNATPAQLQAWTWANKVGCATETLEIRAEGA